VRRRIVIATRGSALARWQAEHVAGLLRGADPAVDVELMFVVTTGDRFQQGPVEEVGGKAVWVKEIEEALIAGTADLAVHSLKDMPSELPDGLMLAAFPVRADPRDALIARDARSLAELPRGARVGTSSPRRVCLLRALRPDLQVSGLRGNVDTRLRKLEDGQADAIVLACAGLDRLGYGARIGERLSAGVFVPAIGQGILGIEIRSRDEELRTLCAALDDPATSVAARAERALLAGLGGSCRTPIAGHAEVVGGTLRLSGLVGRPDGSELLHEIAQAPLEQPEALGSKVAATLRARGAAAILRTCAV
jgi:hydroxymethylbilane synthase